MNQSALACRATRSEFSGPFAFCNPGHAHSSDSALSTTPPFSAAFHDDHPGFAVADVSPTALLHRQFLVRRARTAKSCARLGAA